MDAALVRGGRGAPGLYAAGTALVGLSLLYGVSGTLWPVELPHYAESPRQITGMALMLILTPSYLLVAWTLGQRRSLQLLERMGPLLPDPAALQTAREAMGGALRATWPAGLGVGIALGLLNTDPLRALESHVPLLEASISFGQLVMWGLIGLLLGVRFWVARTFRALGEVVSFDLFRIESLRPLAQAGIVDVVIIAGTLVFTPLQSLDAEFRFVNYQFPLFLAPPISAFLLLWPLGLVHRRLVADRDARIAAVDTALAEREHEVPRDAEDLRSLETLLSHRDRLRDARTWPLGVGLLSRVLVYLVIPPLAWAGAALVERFVESLLGGAG